MKYTFILFAVFLCFAACEHSVPDRTNRLVELRNIVPDSFDSLPVIPDSNIMTTARIALGKKLFYDKRLSSDGSISCATCHQKKYAYADNQAFTKGIHGNASPRNVPTLINVAYQKKLFMEGGVPDLETQVISPFLNTDEMDFSLNAAARMLKTDSAYRVMAQDAYFDTLDAYMIARAIASYERSLISTGSKYDHFLAGDTAALSKEAKNGMNLFFSDRAQCSSCHAGFLFTDQNYYNIGIDTANSDEGRAKITLDSLDLGKFKTPTLRNVSLTAPYMHDGSLRTLVDVIKYYNSGGYDNPYKDPRMDSLQLSQGEINDLILFLNALTDRRMPG